MKERGIIMSGDNPKLILEGRKTQTRRIVKHEIRGPNPPHPPGLFDHYVKGKWEGAHRAGDPKSNALSLCSYGVAGDRLWVRETHAWADLMIDNFEREDAVCVAYKADNTILRHEGSPPLDLDTYAINFQHKSLCWRPSIHMPRWASRITLEITRVRVERVHDISEADAIAEGVEPPDPKKVFPTFGPARHAYRELWDSLHSKANQWEKNPWVWVLEFKRI